MGRCLWRAIARPMQANRHSKDRPRNCWSLVLVGSGALAIPVLLWAGSMSDRLGRKRVGCSFLALRVIGALSFFFLAR